MHVIEKQEEKDKKILKFQLGRENLNPVVKVVKRCSRGFPQVILNLPTKDGKVWFPTIFWLSCPYLHHEISKLENMGLIKHLDAQIESSVWARERFLEDQKRCILLRSSLFSFLKVLDPNGKFFFKRGIGGVTNLKKVKCFHLHYAFFLGTGMGMIGEIIKEKMVLETINPIDCNSNYSKYCGKEDIL